jgi:predicted TIM-barrel fold metal-dependent hydrolase
MNNVAGQDDEAGILEMDPSATLKPPDALVADYKLLQKRIGTTRNVVVTPSTYGTDNRVTLDAMAQIGATARGVAVVDTSVADAELKRMNDLGIPGIRFNLVQAGATTVEMIEPLSKRVNDLGWHIQILSFPKIRSGVVPENSIPRDSRGEGESAHHPMRCLRSSTCLQRLYPICSSHGAGLKSRTSFCVISSTSP